MTIHLWQIEYGSDEYETLTLEQQELADYLWKSDYEGGPSGLWQHSGDMYFPAKLKPLAQKMGALLDELGVAVDRMCRELDIEY